MVEINFGSPKDKIFFGENGLTTTSANYISNIAKECYSNEEEALNEIKFFTTTVKLLGGNEASVLSKGHDDVQFEEIAKRISGLKSLIAWLREAIKAKTRLVKAAESLSFKDFGIEVPECPYQEDAMTEEEYLGTLGVKERNRYYYLETLCAVYGKMLHKEGCFSNARKELNDVLSNPNYIKGEGRDAVLYSRTPTISKDVVNSTFMEMQQNWRNFQAELNSMKHRMEVALNEDALEKKQKYEVAYREYKSEMNVLSAELSKKVKECVIGAQSLKIVIPDSLKGIYDFVNGLGK